MTIYYLPFAIYDLAFSVVSEPRMGIRFRAWLEQNSR